MTDRGRGRVLGAVLAGGASRRMGRDKAMVPLLGRPLSAWALAALAPQVDALVLAGDARPELGVEAVADSVPGRAGPLAGIAAALGYARRRGFARVAVVPCDVPVLPPDLVRLLSAADHALAIASDPDGPQWTIGLWDTALAHTLEADLAAGIATGRGAAVRLWVGARDHALVNFPDRFLDADDATALARLADLLSRR